MEREEVETIPWSNLVVEPASRVDRRWVVSVAVGIVAVVAFLGVRMVSSGGQPTPRVTAAVSSTVTTVAEPSMIVSEDDLRTGIADPSMSIRLRAEWFVTDLFTRDGSAETDRSVLAALHPIAEGADIATIRAEAVAETFVEWARAVDVDFDGDEYRVSVAYRMLTLVDTEYRREPVRMVDVGITLVQGVPLVSTLPSEIEQLWAVSGDVG